MRAPRGITTTLSALVMSCWIADAPADTPKESQPPQWAYFFPDAHQPQVPADDSPKHIPGSALHFSLAQINDLKNPPDWFPQAHAPMPKVVAHGGPGFLLACASCHLASGMGHPESATLAGLPPAYFERQIAEFKSGARSNPVSVDGKPQLNAVQWMINIAREMSVADAHEAAEWFAGLKRQPWVRVVEVDSVAKAYVSSGYSWATLPGAKEPLGERILELPQDVERVAYRDPRVGTIAYVPRGSLTRGEALTRGDGAPGKCVVCHGAGLKGLGEVPAIAGDSPTYLFRQLYAFKMGGRRGSVAALMTPSVAALSESDMIAIAAYVASLPD